MQISKIINIEIDPTDSEGLACEKVDDFEYLDPTLSTKKHWSKEIDFRQKKVEKTFYTQFYDLVSRKNLSLFLYPVFKSKKMKVQDTEKKKVSGYQM